MTWMTGATDLDGNSRISGISVDMGAYEYGPAEKTPLEQIDEILAFFIQAVEDGTLWGVGPGKSAPNRLNALFNMLLEARTLIATGDYNMACGQVMSALHKTDGDVKPPDFVAGSSAPTLADMLAELAASL